MMIAPINQTVKKQAGELKGKRADPSLSFSSQLPLSLLTPLGADAEVTPAGFGEVGAAECVKRFK